MIVHTADFVTSSAKLSQCPKDTRPEFAFIGRSNVGKSSLINMLTDRNKLAKISGTPGKTQTINHFIINDQWYLVDLPGYGYAKVSTNLRENWIREVENYMMKRENLVCLFVLIDSRIKPQDSDRKLMEMLGVNQIPFARVFTKSDKLKAEALKKSVKLHNEVMLETWDELPVTFITSSVKRKGKDEILSFIEQSINNL
jgi:GTP-binding protein